MRSNKRKAMTEEEKNKQDFFFLLCFLSTVTAGECRRRRTMRFINDICLQIFIKENIIYLEKLLLSYLDYKENHY